MRKKFSMPSKLSTLKIKYRVKRCILHIGIEKTGTSTIQRFLADNRDQFRNEAVVYPRTGGAEGCGSNWGFAALASTNPWTKDIGQYLDISSQSDLDFYRASVIRELNADLSIGEIPQTLIISSEHFHSRLCTRKEIRALKTLMNACAETFQIVIYLRRQDRVARSLYSTNIKLGQSEPKPLPKASKRLSYYYDYERVYLNWASVFGQDSMTVRLFDKSEFKDSDLLSDFSSVCGLNMSGKIIPGAVNSSIDPTGTEFLREINRQLQMPDGKITNLRQKISQNITRLCPGKVYPFSLQEARIFYQQFLESNERLKVLVFPGRSSSLFDDDFDEYPEVVAPRPRIYEDAVAIALELISSTTSNYHPMPTLISNTTGDHPPVFTVYPKESFAIALIRQLRQDLRSLIPLNTYRDWHVFLEWLVANGCKEYRALTEDDGFRAYLQEVEPEDSINRLQRLIYSLREDVQKLFTLPGQWTDFEHWFYNHGVEEHGLWQLLSTAEKNRLLQQGLWKSHYGDPVQREILSPKQRPFGVNLIGYAFAQLGIGEDVRMAGRSLLAAGIPFTILNFPPGSDVPQDDQSMHDYVTNDGPYAINVFCLTALEHVRYFLEQGKAQFTGRYNVGYWPWELAKCPREWERICEIVDEVWVSSRHTRRALAPVCPVILKRMPMAVEIGSVSSKGRRDFRLPESALLFCFSFDLKSSIHRKNPLACIEAFNLAFTDNGQQKNRNEVGLVIKAHGSTGNDDEWSEIKRLASKDNRIHVLGRTLTRPDLLALYKCCDCFLSLHRAEGFGRGIAEALQLGLHVITTGYSGNVDFCDRSHVDLVDYELVPVEENQYPFGDGQVWANPDVNQAATFMRTLLDKTSDASRRRETGGFARDCQEFSTKVVGARYRKRLQAIREQYQ
jgi:glycosyltransferase involved in cell wall biosynthesis